MQAHLAIPQLRNATPEEKRFGRELLKAFAMTLNPKKAIELKNYLRSKKVSTESFKFGINQPEWVAKTVPLLMTVMKTRLTDRTTGIPKILEAINDDKFDTADTRIRQYADAWGSDKKLIIEFFTGVMNLKKAKLGIPIQSTDPDLVAAEEVALAV